MQNGYAQVPAGVDVNNLGTVKVDELTDAQILDILKPGLLWSILLMQQKK